MRNPRQLVLDQGFAELIGYSENAMRHKTQNGTWVGNGIKGCLMRTRAASAMCKAVKHDR